ncbi:Mitochondrial division protein [Trichinella pseudospiralis]
MFVLNLGWRQWEATFVKFFCHRWPHSPTPTTALKQQRCGISTSPPAVWLSNNEAYKSPKNPYLPSQSCLNESLMKPAAMLISQSTSTVPNKAPPHSPRTD